MRFSPFPILLATLLATLPAIAQTPTADQLSVLKNLSPDQQQQLMQSVLGGKGDGTGKKTDPSLQSPETVRPRSEQFDQYDKYVKDKTVDGRPLRMPDEDPELRPGDSVLIDLVSIERRRRPVIQDSTTTAGGAGTSALNGRGSLANDANNLNNLNNPNNNSSQKDRGDKTGETDPKRSYGRTP